MSFMMLVGCDNKIQNTDINIQKKKIDIGYHFQYSGNENNEKWLQIFLLKGRTHLFYLIMEHAFSKDGS